MFHTGHLKRLLRQNACESGAVVICYGPESDWESVTIDGAYVVDTYPRPGPPKPA